MVCLGFELEHHNLEAQANPFSFGGPLNTFPFKVILKISYTKDPVQNFLSQITSVTNKKSPKVYKSCPKIISLQKLKILYLYKNLDKLIVAK